MSTLAPSVCVCVRSLGLISLLLAQVFRQSATAFHVRSIPAWVEKLFLVVGGFIRLKRSMPGLGEGEFAQDIAANLGAGGEEMTLGLLNETAHGFRSASAEDLLRANALCSALEGVTCPARPLLSNCARALAQIALVLAMALFLSDPQIALAQTWHAGFDFRATQGFVTDPPGNNFVLAANTMYPTTGNGVTFGWTSTGNNQLVGRDRAATADPRLAGMNFVPNSQPPAVFQVNLPASGTYAVSLAIGDQSYRQCTSTCQIEFRDGSTSLFVLKVSGGVAAGSFADANGQVWSAASWPTSNTTRQITLSGTQLTVLLGTGTGTYSTDSVLAFLGISASSSGAAPTVSLSPPSLTFGYLVVGTTSPAQSVSLTNSGSATLNITSILSSGD